MNICSKQVVLEPVKTQNPAEAAKANAFLDYIARQKNCPSPSWIALTVWAETFMFCKFILSRFLWKMFQWSLSRES